MDLVVVAFFGDESRAEGDTSGGATSVRKLDGASGELSPEAWRELQRIR